MNSKSYLINPSIRSLVLLLLLASLTIQVQSQTLGIGIAPGFTIGGKRVNSAGIVQTYPDRFYPGFQLDINYTVPDYGFPVSAYNNFRFGMYAIGIDTLKEPANFGEDIYIRKSHIRDFALCFGYEIPDDNDFFMGFLGWGMGVQTTRSKILDAYNTVDPNASNLDRSDTKSRGIIVELIGGGTYELQYFFLFGRYNLQANLLSSQSYVRSLSHQFHFGVIIPIIRD